MADTLPVSETSNGLPPMLAYPVSINVRNSDLGVDDSGTASRLDETRIVAMMHKQVPVGTVMFTAINMRALNATARGLIRVTEQHASDDGLAFETFAEFIELSADAKGKISRLLGHGMAPGGPAPVRNFAMEQIGVQPVYARGAATHQDYQVASTERTYFEPAPLRQQAKATKTTRFFGSLGVTAYTAIILAIIACFPVGRGYELLVWNKIAWTADRMWFWANHVGEVKLYNNS